MAQQDEPGIGMASVEIALCEGDGRWRLRLAFVDGEVFMSRASYTDESEARAAALKWATENAVDVSEQVN